MANSFLDKTGLTYLWGKITALVATKQDTLTFDTTPTASSTNPVTSGGIKTALDGKAASDHTQTVAKGGTNIGSYTKGDMIYATAGTTLAKLAIGTAGNFLKATADGPSWAALPTASSSTAGVTTVGASGGAAAYSHTHSGYVAKTGDTMTGVLVANNFVSKYGVEFQNSSGTNVGGIFQDMAGANQFYMDEYTTSGVRECYLLPAPTATSTSFYDILTSKSAVTVAQGGTGATSASGARTNLGLGSMATASTSDYVAKTGDEMSGDLTAPNYIVKGANASTAPAVMGRNSNGQSLGTIDFLTTGQMQFRSYIVGVGSESFKLPAPATSGASYDIITSKGGTMVGNLTLADTDSPILTLSNAAAFTMNKYGNITHKRATTTDSIGIHNSSGAVKFSVEYESGNVTAAGNIISGGGNIYVRKSDSPYIHLTNESNQEVAGLWASISNKRVYLRVRPSAGSSYVTDFIFPGANATANANKYVYTSDNFSLSGTTLTITPPS